MEAMDRLQAGRTVIVIAHRLSTVRRADVIFVMEEGRIVERGTHDELLALGGRYRSLYEVQFSPAAQRRREPQPARVGPHRPNGTFRPEP